jgi:glycosyltransferase involved in cell wall biosynthesis
MVERSIKQLPFFSIITPSHNMLNYLRACCNSISDQNVEFEHIVVDGLSRDGTAEWLETRPEIISLCERDRGMYDAINKGIRLSKGEIISYLNCDEQYLPGVLLRVAEFFHCYSQVDILFGNALIIKPNGTLLAYRKGFVPRWPYIWASYMYVHSGSMFVRRKVFESGILFDQRWKAIGDADFVVRVLRKGFVAHHISEYLSAFMITGSNLGDGENALVELKAFRNKAPLWLRYSNFITHTLIRLEKIWNGAYWEKMPLSYSVYTTENLAMRSEFVAKSASSLYPHEA